MLDYGSEKYPYTKPKETSVEETLDLKCAWISPEGDLYGCRYYQHQALAELILETKGIPHSRLYNDQNDILLKNGWVELTIGLFRFEKELTNRQLDILFDLSLKNSMIREQLEDLLSPPEDLLNSEGESTVTESETIEHKSTERERLIDHDYIEIIVKAYSGNGENGVSLSTFKAFPTMVTADKEDPSPSGIEGEEIGMLSGGIGKVAMSDFRRERGFGGSEFFIRHQDLWRAFQKGLDKKYGQFF